MCPDWKRLEMVVVPRPFPCTLKSTPLVAASSPSEGASTTCQSTFTGCGAGPSSKAVTQRPGAPLSETFSENDLSDTVSVGRVASSVMVAVADDGFPSVAPTGSLKLSVNVSSLSDTESRLSHTFNDAPVVLAGMVSVPLIE